MNCPACGADDDRVVDSRAADGGNAIRRRRECNRCQHRVTTYERLERSNRLVVVKKDGSRTPFDPDHIMRGVRAACGKRPVPEAEKDALVDAVETQLHREFDREVSSREIGERVAQRLRDIDEIAYIRYASEYYSFKTLDELVSEATQIKGRRKDAPGQESLFEAKE
ncbi:MAG: transcriptional regulator NrdR [Phycisphaerales bacterium]|nr:transcriptional regulator NrdR [Phycisphaerales bacterium]